MPETEYKEVYQGPKKIRIPESWSIERFDSDLFTEKIQAGGTPKATNDEFYGGDIPFVKIEDMTAAGKFLYDTSNTLTEEGFEDATAWRVPKKSLLLSMYGSYGKVAITERELTTNQAILGIIPSDETDLEYIYYAAQRMRPYYEAMVRETTQANLTKGIVTKTPLVRPPLPEQRRIAEILSTVDEAIQQTDEIIETSKELKKGLMQDFFTYGLDDESTKQVRLGAKKIEIPSSWGFVRLGEDGYADILTGGTPSTDKEEYWGGEVPWMRSGEIHKRRVKEVEERITQEGLENSRAEYIPDKCVLVGMNGQGKTKGTVAVNLKELTLNQSLGAYDLDRDEFDPFFVYYFLSSKYNYLRSLAGNNGRAGLNLTLLGKVQVPKPPLDEQRKIAEKLSTVDEKIRQEEEYREKLEDLKKGLMQDLLTGEVRVNVERGDE